MSRVGIVCCSNRFACMAFTLFCFSIFSSQGYAQTYRVTPLVAVDGGTTSFASAISDNGTVAGYSLSGSLGHYDATVWSNASPSIAWDGGPFGALAEGINDSGLVVGIQLSSFAEVPKYDLDGIVGLVGLGPNGSGPVPFGAARAVNKAGQVAGWMDPFSSCGQLVGPSQAAVWDNVTASPTLLGTFAGVPACTASAAEAINESGQIVGKSTTAGGQIHATKWHATVPTDLGTLGGTTSVATGINTFGLIVGSSSTAGDAATHATLWILGRLIDLGTLGGSGSTADGINLRGEVVGWAQTVAGAQHATLWRHGRPVDLNTRISNPGVLPYVLTEATAINRKGWIAANAALANGDFRAYLLTPVRGTEALFAELLDDAKDVGLSNNLLEKLTLAQTYFEANDIDATCPMLLSFVEGVEAQAGRNIRREAVRDLIRDTEEIRSALNCRCQSHEEALGTNEMSSDIQNQSCRE